MWPWTTSAGTTNSYMTVPITYTMANSATTVTTTLPGGWLYNPVTVRGTATQSTGMTYGYNVRGVNDEAFRRRENERWRRQRAETEAVRKRARRLLVSCLSTAQRRQLEEADHFEVVGSAGRRYRIHRGQIQNVVELDPHGEARSRWCGHPRSVNVPDEDSMLAQKLLLETDEDAYRNRANLIGSGRAAA